MSTLNVMRANIADFINRTDLDTQIDLAINRAILFYSRNHRFWFNEKTATFSTVNGTFAYDASATGISDMLKRDLVMIAINSTDNVELIERTYKYVQQCNVANTTGTPTDYAFYKENFYIYPVPNAAYTITVSYLQGYSTLTSGQSNDFTDYAEDLIESRAMWWLYRRILRNYESALDSKNEENEAFLNLINQTSRLIATGNVRPTSY